MTMSATVRLRLRRVAVVAALLVMPSYVLAQDNGPELLDFRYVTVAADKNAEWLSLLSETRKERQEAGQPYFHVFERLRGPLGVYLVVTPHAKIGAPATRQTESAWHNRFQHTIASQSLITAMLDRGASTIDSSWAHPSAPYLLSRVFVVKGELNREYRKWLAEELAPAYRDAGADDARTLRSFVGYSPNTWFNLTFIDSWPGGRLGLDPKMLNKGAAMVASQKYYLYEFREDLSYTAD